MNKIIIISFFIGNIWISINATTLLIKRISKKEILKSTLICLSLIGWYGITWMSYLDSIK